MIRLTKLCKQYESKNGRISALNSVNLNINDGDFAAVMGPSGSGKSTLMNIIGCLDRPSGGNYFLDDTNINSLPAYALAAFRNRYIGFVFQSFFLLNKLTALQNIELPMMYSGVSAARRRKSALEMIDLIGLNGREAHFPSQLSGGQRQRVAIGRALINRPKLVLADEPTGNLDYESSLEIMDVLWKLNQIGTTVLLITHSAEIAQYADTQYIMRQGELMRV